MARSSSSPFTFLSHPSAQFVRVLVAFNVCLTVVVITLGYAFITSPQSTSSTAYIPSLSASAAANSSFSFLSSLTTCPTCPPPTSTSSPSSSLPFLPHPSLLPSTWAGLSTLHDYAAFHSAALSSTLSSLPPTNRFHSPTPPSSPPLLIWQLRDYRGAGFGNRLIGALSGLYLAMATHRVFLLTDDKLDLALRPNAIHYPHAPHTQPTLHVQLPLNTQQDLGCGDLRQLWSTHTAITLETTQYFLPLLSHNPHLREWSVEAFGGDATQFAQHLLAFLFLPSTQLQKLVLDYAQLHHFRPMQLDPYHTTTWTGRTWRPSSSSSSSLPHQPVIGLQIRREHMYEADRESVEFMNCAQAVHADLAHTLSSHLPTTPTSNPTPTPATPLRVFVATDDAGKTIGLAQSHLPPSASTLRYEGAHAALVDLYLLSLCDALVITWPRSTFGSIAVALSGLLPHTVHSSKGVRGLCTRQLTTEPCFHGWFRRRDLQCWTQEGHETYEMLNQDNCYQCKGNGGCAEGFDEPSDTVCPFGTCPPKYD